jgi:hypothetical protein
MPRLDDQDKTGNVPVGKDTMPSPHLRKLAHWLVVISFFVVGVGFFLNGELMLYNNPLSVLNTYHFAATIMLPSAALAALCIVIILEGTAGPIQIEGLGFKFKGAAGPIVFWIFCFLAITYAVHLLW